MVEAFSVALDGVGGVYIGGAASSNYFVTQNSIQQTGAWGVPYAAAVKFSTDGQTVSYATMFGDSVGGGQIQALAADPQGNLYVAGVTEGNGTFPLVNPVQNHAGTGEDVFVAIINPQGNALTFSTYLGGNGDDWPQDLTMDAAGRIYVVGYTLSSDFPVLNPAPTSVPKVGEGKPYYGFLSAFAPGGQSLLYSMYIGGSGAVDDFAWGSGHRCGGQCLCRRRVELSRLSGYFQRLSKNEWRGIG